ncbi:MAG: ABC transporter ATP-binding protein [Lentisphaeria bacterium]|nr:ABC transporter ATP-binding protein [Lentisphaeria bacterium]
MSATTQRNKSVTETLGDGGQSPASPLIPPSQSYPDVLKVKDLRVYFYTEEGEIRAVDGVSFCMRRGRVTALVGESGCGKSVTSYSILRLIQKPGKIMGGSITFYPAEKRGPRTENPERADITVTGVSPTPPSPIDITSLSENSDDLFHLRGGRISMIFQEPMTALSPVHTVGNQICEAIRLHQKVSKQEARKKAIAMLGKVGIPGPEQRIDQYPFEMSGGMRQRVVIAMALVCDPEILIADEPTTALDVTIQAQIMGLIKDLQRDLGTSTLLITHDLGVVAQLADDVAVMYLGRIVERGPVRQIMKAPYHPYTQALLRSLPSLSMNKSRLPSIEGSVPSLSRIPPGCPFHPRCPHAETGLCDTGGPPLLEDIAAERSVACLRWRDIGKEHVTGGDSQMKENT